MVGADSHGISRAPWYSGVLVVILYNLSLTRLSLSLAVLSRTIQLDSIITTESLYRFTQTSHYTYIATHTGLHDIGLGSSQFAHHYYGNHIRFLFLALLRCFSSGRWLSYPMNSDKRNTVLPYWVSPFGNFRIKAWLTAPRSLWQPSASFIAFWCQGIHQIPLLINYKTQFQ